MAANPYDTLPERAFWRTAVAQRGPFQIEGLWNPKHPLTKDERILTAGSCFAQHIGRALASRGYNWFNAESGPAIFDEETRKQFGYGVFSFRTGNIYTVAALKQWVLWAFGEATIPEEVWERDGRYFDPFRPAIEPDGFASVAELQLAREATLLAIKRAINKANLFVFTLGLTEAWLHRRHGTVYAMCPGTVAGTFDSRQHEFRNYAYPQIERDLVEVMDLISVKNRNMRFLLTVSPVPLTATASGQHALTSTTYSKSVLRAVAGAVADRRADTDYFPSYEIITGVPFRGMFFEPNLRSVAPDGVDFVMKSFFKCLSDKFGEDRAEEVADAPETLHRKQKKGRRDASPRQDDVVCEEAMLDAFGGN
jgi:hypothetical protein